MEFIKNYNNNAALVKDSAGKDWVVIGKGPPFVEHLQELLPKGDVLFLYGAKDEEHNQAVVLKEAAEEALAKLP